MSNPINFAKGYVLCAQANCHNRPQAMIELVQYLNSAMKNYQLNADNDEIVNNRRKNCKSRRKGRPKPNLNLDGFVENFEICKKN